MSDTFYVDFVHTIPQPVMYLVEQFFMPDFNNVVSTMRDAPTLESEPDLSKEACFFCL